MADTRKVDNEGRILIPAHIRALAGLTRGARFVCESVEGGVLVKSAEGVCPACSGTGKATPDE